MKLLVLLFALVLSTIAATTESNKQDKSKNPTPTPNTIPQSAKYETYYQQPQPQLKYQPVPRYIQVPVHLIQKPFYIQSQHPNANHAPQAMIIIAQPAYLPQSLVYANNPTQHLINYFQNNPQAKYQLLHGTFPGQQQAPQHQAPPTTYMQPVVAPAPSSLGPNYVLAPVSPTEPQQYQLPAAPAPPQYHQQVYHQQLQQQQQPQARFSNFAAYLAAQREKAAPPPTPIVTGFENFTPEQQAQIKEQLNSQFGGNYHTLGGGRQIQQPQYSAKYNNVLQEDGEQGDGSTEEVEFVPSPQVELQKEERSGTNIMKARRFNSNNNKG